jgi:hypothetical protein
MHIFISLSRSLARSLSLSLSLSLNQDPSGGISCDGPEERPFNESDELEKARDYKERDARTKVYIPQGYILGILRKGLYLDHLRRGIYRSTPAQGYIPGCTHPAVDPCAKYLE